MKNIVFYIQSLRKGGTERVVSVLAEKFAMAGYNTVIATIEKSEDEFELSPLIERVYVGLTPEDEKKCRPVKTFMRVKHLREFLKERHPDVVLSFLKKPVFYSLAASRGLHIPVIVCERTYPEHDISTFADRFLMRHLVKNAAGFVFQTEGQRDFYTRFIKNVYEKSVIILNPINRRYLNVPKKERLKEVVHHARLVDFKDQQLMIRAFKRVHEKHPDYVLKIYGEDSHDGTKEVLEKTIAETDSSSYVFLPGGDVDFTEVIPQGSVYLFSSYYEGLSNSVMEAMAMGMPIVATDCPSGGNRTLIQDGENGLLVPMHEEKPMADAVCRLIEDRDFAEKLGANAALIKERADEDKIFAMWTGFIERVTATA